MSSSMDITPEIEKQLGKLMVANIQLAARAEQLQRENAELKQKIEELQGLAAETAE